MPESCTMYGGHPDLSCAKYYAQDGRTPHDVPVCAPCERVILRDLVSKAQGLIKLHLDGDWELGQHDDGCPEDDTCECEPQHHLNLVMNWKAR